MQHLWHIIRLTCQNINLNHLSCLFYIGYTSSIGTYVSGYETLKVAQNGMVRVHVSNKREEIRTELTEDAAYLG